MHNYRSLSSAYATNIGENGEYSTISLIERPSNIIGRAPHIKRYVQLCANCNYTNREMHSIVGRARASDRCLFNSLEIYAQHGSMDRLTTPRSQPNKEKKDWQRGESETGPDELLKQY